jgi:hypothetical protein
LRPAAATTLAVALALLLNLLLRPRIGANTFPLFLAAVGVAAWYGGPALGLVAAVLSALMIRYLFIEPAYSFPVDPDRLQGVDPAGSRGGERPELRPPRRSRRLWHSAGCQVKRLGGKGLFPVGTWWPEAKQPIHRDYSNDRGSPAL